MKYENNEVLEALVDWLLKLPMTEETIDMYKSMMASKLGKFGMAEIERIHLEQTEDKDLKELSIFGANYSLMGRYGNLFTSRGRRVNPDSEPDALQTISNPYSKNRIIALHYSYNNSPYKFTSIVDIFGHSICDSARYYHVDPANVLSFADNSKLSHRIKTGYLPIKFINTDDMNIIAEITPANKDINDILLTFLNADNKFDAYLKLKNQTKDENALECMRKVLRHEFLFMAGSVRHNIGLAVNSDNQIEFQEFRTADERNENMAKATVILMDADSKLFEFEETSKNQEHTDSQKQPNEE